MAKESELKAIALEAVALKQAVPVAVKQAAQKYVKAYGAFRVADAEARTWMKAKSVASEELNAALKEFDAAVAAANWDLSSEE